MEKPELSPDSLFRYVRRFARRHELADRGTVYPTVRRAARRFRTTVDEIERVADEGVGDGYLGIGVGLKNYVGAYVFKHRGDQLVEAYR